MKARIKVDSTRALATMAALGAAIVGCGSEAKAPSGTGEASYALVTVVFGDNGRTTYVNLLDSLDLSSVDLGEAREFPGLAGVAANAGKVFVSSAEAPTVSRFATTGRAPWTEEGRVDFGNYGEPDLLTNIFANAQKGYMPLEVVSRVVWDPTALEIKGMRAASPNLPVDRDGLSVRLGYHHAVRGDVAFQTFYWSDADFFEHGAMSQIALYDTSTDETKALLDVACPGLQVVSHDEAGNLYFSNSTSAVTPRLFSTAAPTPCMARIMAGQETIDPTFALTFSDLTGGRQGGTFQYLGNGKGFFQVFHHERVTITPDADPWEISSSPNWRLWGLDLSTRSAAPIEGIDFFGGQYAAFTVDGRTFVLLPSADYATTATYEILADGTAIRRGESMGWAYLLLEVR